MFGGAIVFAGLMPHAPILVPGVGRERLEEAAATAKAMEQVARRAVAAHPDTIILISPHSPRRSGAFGIWQTPKLHGTLGRFGSENDQVNLPLDRAFANRLETVASRSGLRTWKITGEPLDHGATVPLCYLASAGWNGPTVILSLNYPGEGNFKELGQAIAATAQALHRRSAVIASGDMSHRLTETAPCGYHPDGHKFDETFIGLLRQEELNDIQQIDAALQDSAAEDVMDSTVVALAAAGDRVDGREVLSYEGPFGVGYGVAILFEPEQSKPAGPPAETAKVISRCEDLPAVARRAVESEFDNGPKAPPFQASGEASGRRGVFVTLRTDKGELRGCRGSLTPTENDLVGETWRCAVTTALRDYRFSPVEAAELPRLRFSVTVLDELEPVASEESLDPRVYGIVVTAADGRKGVLLPDIAGIDSVVQQVALARSKADIEPGEPVEMQRFTARCFKESPGAE